LTLRSAVPKPSHVPRDLAFDTFVGDTREFRKASRRRKAELLVTDWLQAYQDAAGNDTGWSQHHGATMPPGVHGNGPLDRHPKDVWRTAFRAAGYSHSTIVVKELRPGSLLPVIDVRLAQLPNQVPRLFRMTHADRRDRWSWSDSLELVMSIRGTWERGDRLYMIERPAEIFATMRHSAKPLPGSRLADVMHTDWTEYICDPGTAIHELDIRDAGDRYVISEKR
jgi:hypothetical protein